MDVTTGVQSICATHYDNVVRHTGKSFLAIHLGDRLLIQTMFRNNTFKSYLFFYDSSTYLLPLSGLRTLRTGSLTFMSSVIFIPFTILSTAIPLVGEETVGTAGAGICFDQISRHMITDGIATNPLRRTVVPAIRVSRACIAAQM